MKTNEVGFIKCQLCLRKFIPESDQVNYFIFSFIFVFLIISCFDSAYCNSIPAIF